VLAGAGRADPGASCTGRAADQLRAGRHLRRRRRLPRSTRRHRVPPGPHATSGMEYAATSCDGTARPAPIRPPRRPAPPDVQRRTAAPLPAPTTTAASRASTATAGRCAAKLGAAGPAPAPASAAAATAPTGRCCNSPCTETCFACNLSARRAVQGRAQRTGSAQQLPTAQTLRHLRRRRRLQTAAARAACTRTRRSAGPAPAAAAPRRRPPGDGLGTSAGPAAPHDCSPYLCGRQRLRRQLPRSSSCSPVTAARRTACARSYGLIVLWRFEETSGTTAVDISGKRQSRDLHRRHRDAQDVDQPARAQLRQQPPAVSSRVATGRRCSCPSTPACG
jgi:hypothetical protein